MVIRVLIVICFSLSAFSIEFCDIGYGQIDLFNFVRDTSFGTCKACPENCAYCFPIDSLGNELRCSSCKDGFYIDKNFECQACLTGCSWCTGPSIESCIWPLWEYSYNSAEDNLIMCQVEGCGACDVYDANYCYFCDIGYMTKSWNERKGATCTKCEEKGCAFCFNSKDVSFELWTYYHYYYYYLYYYYYNSYYLYWYWYYSNNLYSDWSSGGNEYSENISDWSSDNNEYSDQSTDTTFYWYSDRYCDWETKWKIDKYSDWYSDVYSDCYHSWYSDRGGSSYQSDNLNDDLAEEESETEDEIENELENDEDNEDELENENDSEDGEDEDNENHSDEKIDEDDEDDEDDDDNEDDEDDEDDEDAFRILGDSSNDVCLICMDEWVTDHETGTCKLCEYENCEYCSSKYKTNESMCWVCNLGYYFDYKLNKCMPGTIDNCYIFDYYSDNCQYCDFGYRHDKGGTYCKDCIELGEHCKDCKTTNGRGECVLCDSGYQFDTILGECVQCTIPNCSLCGKSEYDGQINTEYCFGCFDGFVWDRDTKSCVPPCTTISGCHICSKSDQCTSCVDGTYFDENTKQCEPCHSSCLTCHGPQDYDCNYCSFARYFYYNPIYPFDWKNTTTLNYFFYDTISILYNMLFIYNYYEPLGRILENNEWEDWVENQWVWLSSLQCFIECPNSSPTIDNKSVNVFVSEDYMTCLPEYANISQIPFNYKIPKIEKLLNMSSEFDTSDMVSYYSDFMANIEEHLSEYRYSDMFLQEFNLPSVPTVNQSFSSCSNCSSECSNNGYLVTTFDEYNQEIKYCSCNDDYVGLTCFLDSTTNDQLEKKMDKIISKLMYAHPSNPQDSTETLEYIQEILNVPICLTQDQLNSIAEKVGELALHIISYSSNNLVDVETAFAQAYMISKVSSELDSNKTLRTLSYASDQELFNKMLLAIDIALNLRTYNDASGILSAITSTEGYISYSQYKINSLSDNIIKINDPLLWNGYSGVSKESMTVIDIPSDFSKTNLSNATYLIAGILSQSMIKRIQFEDNIKTNLIQLTLRDSDGNIIDVELQKNITFYLAIQELSVDGSSSNITCSEYDESTNTVMKSNCISTIEGDKLVCSCNSFGTFVGTYSPNLEEEEIESIKGLSILPINWIILSVLLLVMLLN